MAEFEDEAAKLPTGIYYYNTRTKEFRSATTIRPGAGLEAWDPHEWILVDTADQPKSVHDEALRMIQEHAKGEGERILGKTKEEITQEVYKAISELPPPDVSWNEPESILSEAKRLVEGGERNQQYGPPEMDFARIATMVTALLRHKLKDGEIVLDADVARIMICLKLSRSLWSGKRDNWVDIAGYAACGHRCETGEW